MGYFGGKGFVKKYGKYFFMKDDEVQKSNSWFDKYGLIAACIGRNVPIVRTLVSLPIGVARLSFKKFLIYSVLCLMFAASACNSDFDVTDKWEDSPAIYCVLDKSQSMQYVKVNKSFLGNLPASEMATVSDSLFYDCDVQVKLHRKQGKSILKTWNFWPSDSIPKLPGQSLSEDR